MSRFKTRARLRDRAAEQRAAAGRPERRKVRDVAAQRGTLRDRGRTAAPVTNTRITINAALLVIALGGAALQLIEASRHVPGEHRTWLAVYLFIAVYAAFTLSARLKTRRAAK